MSVKVTVPKRPIKAAINELGEVAERRYEKRRLKIGEAFVQICTKFVPWKTGEMARSGHAYISSKDEVRAVWSKSKKGVSISEIQYIVPYNHEHNPPLPTDNGLRTDHWATAAMALEKETFKERCEEILNR